MWCLKISSLRNLCKGPVLYPAKNEEIYGIAPYQKFFMSCISRSLWRFAIANRMANFAAGMICLHMFSIVTLKIP